MKTEDLLWLINNGHMIGYHTKSHSRLSELNMNELKIEIDLGLDNLEKITKKVIQIPLQWAN
jgi:peptidoglycan/xylan/chitin deacetylase (PgdA/CDA1 family)